ncbi:hypothetical protein O181_013754 [Austropuccinia psidii MF-1]|uniref:Chromo domain-containing protein n=1 Tax=Austropuccinia psidii MF-1 TaxID=1389203 RepID=A0A9Q3GP67_9BASI|nr:hypothetical protein [Austropuccinia psidii MF-1]
MDLPPSSYHDSLEEWWDEEEEPEEVKTVLKVVPFVYHQYLDVFSKVKAEKLPPHRACDHHIELVGYLPPVGSVSSTQRGFHHHSNPSLPSILETDASNYALSAVLSQFSDSGKYPIAFDSRKHIPAELNYEIHDKELLGIVWALKHWRAFLLYLSSPFEVLTEYSSLQYFMSSKVLTRRAEFHFSINTRPGHLDTLPDALSCRDDIYLERGEDFISKNPINFQQIIKQNEVQHSRYFSVKVESFSNFIDSIQKRLWQDLQCRSILQELGKDTPSGNLSTEIQSVQQDVKRELEAAINRFKRYADKSRASPPVFSPGDMVCLSSKKIKSTIPTKKLSEIWLGPFPIWKQVSTHAYHLKLPSQWKSIHPVFHISLLEPVKTSTIPNRNQEPPPPIIIEEEEEWEVSQILDSKLKRRKLWYLVEWKGFSKDPERSTWEPAKNLKNCPELVKDFHSLYPVRPGPKPSRA